MIADYEITAERQLGKPSRLYYFNPESLDRNLEWDMKNNLCPCPGDIGAPKP